MKKISDCVASIIHADETAYEAFRRGVLNLSAYADVIKPTIEKETWKQVKLGSIVVALSRLQKSVIQTAPLKPPVTLYDVTTTSPLVDISFEKGNAVTHAISQVQDLAKTHPSMFLAITTGIREVTIIVSETLTDDILRIIPAKPKSIMNHLTGLTMHFSDQYLEIPNVLYSLMSTFAIKRINIREIVSTYTELTVVIDAEETTSALEALMKNT
jgi:aspartokinase